MCGDARAEFLHASVREFVGRARWTIADPFRTLRTNQAGFGKRLCERRDGGTLRGEKSIAVVQPRGEFVGVGGAFDQ